jgi:oligosaccharyltransferase complex subunit delta (ribophorin II)
MVPVTTLNPLLDPPTKELLQQQMHAALGESNVIYGPKPEIHYVFRPDAKSPPKLITLVFLSAVIAAYAGLFTTWFSLLGANYEHLPKAFKSSPVAHASFFSSLVAIEIIFFLYYTTWNLFQTLTASCAVGLVAFVSGSRALREVRSRRQGGER